MLPNNSTFNRWNKYNLLGSLEQNDRKYYLIVPLLQDNIKCHIMGLSEYNDRKCYFMVPLFQDDTKCHLMGLLEQYDPNIA